jgi:glycerol-3-phosphate dehydrogenase subunit C
VKSAFKDSRTSRGRMILIQSLVQGIGNIKPYSPSFKELIDLCYSCRRCVAVCPAGIPIPDLNSHARHAYLKKRGESALTFGHRIFANYGTFDRLASTIAPISNWMLRRHAVRMLMQWATHIDSRALLPSFQSDSFESWFRNHPTTSRSKKIAYFVDSYANYNDPTIGKLAVALLEHLGYQVILPPQKESAMPAVEYGMLDKARELAEYNIEQLAPYARDGIQILCTSLAAAYLLKDGYKTFVNDPNLSVVSGAVVDIAEFLHREYEKGNLQFQDDRKQQAKYHVCCLSKTLAIAPMTAELLKAAGLECEQIEDCCGGAGVWGTFKENYAISSEIASKFRNKNKIEEGTTIITESETCRLQIMGHTKATVRFPLEHLAARVKAIKQY